MSAQVLRNPKPEILNPKLLRAMEQDMVEPPGSTRLQLTALGTECLHPS